ncbi:hypothetical protein AB0O64_06720 [Streptomyces sp. NPDC088341]|uniref:hypothetical protein n=1 Tax=Streptomyces sp. NPDC088341 TaxID=3154870 RepID=UPI00341CF853
MTVTTAPRIRRGALAALCTVAVLTLPACGATGSDGKDPGTKKSGASTSEGSDRPSGKPDPFADLSGPEIVEKSFTAIRAASSLTLHADTKEDTGTVLTDMALNRKGDCAGTMSMNGEGTATVSKLGPTVYMKFDEKMLRAQGKGQPKTETDAVVGMLADRWVKTDAKAPDAKDFVGFCDLDELLGEFENGDSFARKGPLSTVNGQRAITLTETDGTSDYTMYVATEGEPYLLKIVVKGKDAGTMLFTDFDKPVQAKVPADKDIVDLDGIGG